jgi:integrase
MTNLYGMVRGRLSAAGVEPPGKRGPHVFRHARAVEMLRASAKDYRRRARASIHRSTNTYLKLATDDLRAVALDVPGMEVLS